jgi:hypothetical protein
MGLFGPLRCGLPSPSRWRKQIIRRLRLQLAALVRGQSIHAFACDGRIDSGGFFVVNGHHELLCEVEAFSGRQQHGGLKQRVIGCEHG